MLNRLLNKLKYAMAVLKVKRQELRIKITNKYNAFIAYLSVAST